MPFLDRVDVAYRVLWSARGSSLLSEKIPAALEYGKYDVYRLCQSEAMRTLLFRWAIYEPVVHAIVIPLGIPPDATDITGHTLLYYCLADPDNHVDTSLYEIALCFLSKHDILAKFKHSVVCPRSNTRRKCAL